MRVIRISGLERVRGLNNATSSLVTKSMDAISETLNRLQSKHAKARLTDVISPLRRFLFRQFVSRIALE